MAKANNKRKSKKSAAKPLNSNLTSVTFRIPKSVKKLITKAAEDDDRSVNSWVIADWKKRLGKPTTKAEDAEPTDESEEEVTDEDESEGDEEVTDEETDEETVEPEEEPEEEPAVVETVDGDDDIEEEIEEEIADDPDEG